MEIVIFILILSFLVLIHELGHFLMAKRFGVIVEEFGLGYPPRAIKLFKKWGTIFTLNWVPFGGFVKMKGEFAEETDADSKTKTSSHGEFSSKSALPRLTIILAGATVNFLYGILAFSLVFSFKGIPATEAIISSVQPGSPAAAINLPTNLKITAVKVDDQVIQTPTYPEVSELLREVPGKTVTLQTTGPCDKDECLNQATEYIVQLRPESEVTDEVGPLGVSFETRFFYPWYEMPIRGIVFGLEQAVFLGWSILQGLGAMLTQLVTQGVVPQDVAGPVGIVHQAQKSDLFRDLESVILFSGMISINLAIMNVLPVPALDGGRALFIILEKIIGKKKVAQVEGYANYGGFIFLIALIVLITARDISRIINP